MYCHEKMTKIYLYQTHQYMPSQLPWLQPPVRPSASCSTSVCSFTIRANIVLHLGQQGSLLLPLRKQANHMPRVSTCSCSFLTQMRPHGRVLGSNIPNGNTRAQAMQLGSVKVNTPSGMFALLSISKSFSWHGLQLSIFIMFKIKNEKTSKYLSVDFRHQ